MNGHVAVLRWLLDQSPPCPVDGTACVFAAEGGHLEAVLLLWPRIPPAPWPWRQWACAGAAKKGRLEVLQALRKLNPPCEWDGHTILLANLNGHPAVADRARDHGCPDDWAPADSRAL
jgi:hypothetical protein